MGRGVWVAAVLTAFLVAGHEGGVPALQVATRPSAPRPAEQVISLENSTRPLEQYFNQTKHQARFLALLSPT
jgi:hypothetical protein